MKQFGRAVLIFSFLPVFFFLSALLRLFTTETQFRPLCARLVHHFSRFFLFILGVKVEKNLGELPRGNFLIVANHLSYLDALVVSSLRPCLFVTSMETREDFLPGLICRLGGCLFVERRRRLSMSNSVSELEEVLQSGLDAAIFPEGTSTNGETVLPFKASLFQSAINSGTAILPLTLHYSDRRIPYCGDDQFVPHLFRLFAVASVTAKVAVRSPLLSANHPSRKELATMAHAAVSTLMLLFSFASFASPMHNATSPARFAAFDKNYRHRAEESQARAALEGYRKLYAANAKDTEASWRVAMAAHYVGLKYETDSDKRIALFEDGKTAGAKGLELDKSCTACHFWTAINIALYGQEVGPFKTIFTLGEVEEHLKAAIEREPDYAYGGAYRLLGIIQQKLPGILGGSNDKAKEYFEKAIAAAPSEPLNYLFLSRLLANEFDDKEAARKWIEKGLQTPEPTFDRVESLEAYHELQQLQASHQTDQSAG